jgi:hypothetical protein
MLEYSVEAMSANFSHRIGSFDGSLTSNSDRPTLTLKGLANASYALGLFLKDHPRQKRSGAPSSVQFYRA